MYFRFLLNDTFPLITTGVIIEFNHKLEVSRAVFNDSAEPFHIQTVEARQTEVNVSFSQSLSHNSFQTSVLRLHLSEETTANCD